MGRYVATIVPTGITWFQASDAAAARGGYLVSITSAAENTLVASLIEDEGFWAKDEFTNAVGPWIGLFQDPAGAEPSGGWKWQSGEPFVYENWAINEPNEHNAEDHANFFEWGYFPPNDEWNDAPGNSKVNGYIAEFDQSVGVVKGTNFRDVVMGGGKADKMSGFGGNDEIYGRGGNDILAGGAGADRLFGQAGADYLKGGAGNDTLMGDKGNDRLDGGGGDDIFDFLPGTGTDRILNWGDSAGNQDVVNLMGFAAKEFLDLAITESNGNAVITLGTDKIILVGIDAATLDWQDFYFS